MSSVMMPKSRMKAVHMFRDDGLSCLVPERKTPFNVRQEIGINPDIISEIGPRLQGMCFPTPTSRGHIEPPSCECKTVLRTMAAEFMPVEVFREVGHALITFNIFCSYLHKQARGQRGVLPVDGRLVQGFVSIQDELSVLSAHWRTTTPGGWLIELFSTKSCFVLRPGSKLILPATAKAAQLCVGQVCDSVDTEATSS